MEELVINLDLLETYKSSFRAERNRFFLNSFNNAFNPSLLNTNSNSTVAHMGTHILSKYQSISNGYQAINDWWDSYIAGVIYVEDMLKSHSEFIHDYNTSIAYLFSYSPFSSSLLEASEVDTTPIFINISDLSDFENVSDEDLRAARDALSRSNPLARGALVDLGMQHGTVITFFDMKTGHTFQGTAKGDGSTYHIDWNYRSRADRAIAEGIAGGRHWTAREVLITFEGSDGNTHSFTGSYHTLSHDRSGPTRSGHQCLHGSDEWEALGQSTRETPSQKYRRDMHERAVAAENSAEEWIERIDAELLRRDPASIDLGTPIIEL